MTTIAEITQNSVPDIGWIVVVVLVSLAVFIFQTRRGMADAEEEIRRWAEGNRLEILQVRRPFFVPLMRSSRGVRFFHLTVRDNAGLERCCWFSCEYWSRKDSRHVEIIWDETNHDKLA